MGHTTMTPLASATCCQFVKRASFGGGVLDTAATVGCSMNTMAGFSGKVFGI